MTSAQKDFTHPGTPSESTNPTSSPMSSSANEGAATGASDGCHDGTLRDVSASIMGIPSVASKALVPVKKKRDVGTE